MTWVAFNTRLNRAGRLRRMKIACVVAFLLALVFSHVAHADQTRTSELIKVAMVTCSSATPPLSG